MSRSETQLQCLHGQLGWITSWSNQKAWHMAGQAVPEAKAEWSKVLATPASKTDSAPLQNASSVWSIQYIFINLSVETLPFWKSLLNWLRFFFIYLLIGKPQRFKSKNLIIKFISLWIKQLLILWLITCWQEWEEHRCVGLLCKFVWLTECQKLVAALTDNHTSWNHRVTW